MFPKRSRCDESPVSKYSRLSPRDSASVKARCIAEDQRTNGSTALEPGRRRKTLFDQIGCNVCHTRSMVTVEPETPINGGALLVARALGNKRIRPFGDFLLHDVGTGDGIVQNGGASTRNKVRTAPLWGLHARTRFMHDFQSHSIDDAIQRHANQAQPARSAFNALSSTDRRRLLTFLRSL